MNSKPEITHSSTNPLIEKLKEALINKDLPAFTALVEEHGLHAALNERGLTPFLMCCLADAEGFIENILKDNENLDNIIAPSHHFNIIKVITYAGSYRCLALLIEAGIDVNATRQDNISALMFAARYGHLQCVELLLAAGARVDAQNHHKHSAALLAAAHGHYHCLQQLIFAGAELNYYDHNGHTPLMLAAGNGHLNCIALLLENGASLHAQNRHYQNALLLAAYHGQVEACRLLLIWGAPCNKNIIPNNLRFTKNVDATTRAAIANLLDQQQQWLYQFETLGYSRLMSLLYRGELSEQALIDANILYHIQQCQTPNCTTILRAIAFSRKPNLLLTAVILLTDGDLLLAADMISKLKINLKHPCQQTFKNTLTLIKAAQRTLNKYQDLLIPSAAKSILPIELLQTQILATLLKEIKSNNSKWLEILIDKIISHASLLNHQRLEARDPSSNAFMELALTHPLLLAETKNIHQQINHHRLSWQPSPTESGPTAIFNNQPLSIRPAYVLWQQYLFEPDSSRQLNLLLELLTQHQSPWLKNASPIVWQQLIINLARPLELAGATTLATKLNNLLLNSHTTTSPQALTQLLKVLAQHQSIEWLTLFSKQNQVIFDRKLAKGINTPQKAMTYYVTEFPEYFDKHHPLIATVLSGNHIEQLPSLDWQPFVDGLAQLLSCADYINPYHDDPDGDIGHRRIEKTEEIITTAVMLWPFLNGAQLQQLLDLAWQTALATCGCEEYENALEYALEIKFLHTLNANLTEDLTFLQQAMTELTSHFGKFFKANDPFIQAIFRGRAKIELMDIDRQDFEQSLVCLFASEEYADLWLDDANDDNDDAIKLRENTLRNAASFFSVMDRNCLAKIITCLDELGVWAGPIHACKSYIHHLLLAAKDDKNSILQRPEAFIHRMKKLMLIHSLLRGQYGMLEENMGDYSSENNKLILQALFYLIEKNAISLADAKSLFAINNHHAASIKNGLSLLQFSQCASQWYASHSKSKTKISTIAGRKRIAETDCFIDDNKRHHTKNKPCQIAGLQFQPITGDGHCFFNAVALYTNHTMTELRTMVAQALNNNFERYQDFINLQDGQTIEDYIDGIMTNQWAGHVEIDILMRVLNRPIIIVTPQNTLNLDRVHELDGDCIFIQYNGENHYDALLLDNSQTEQQVLQILAHHNQPMPAIIKMSLSPFFRAGQKRIADDDLESDANLKRHHPAL